MKKVIFTLGISLLVAMQADAQCNAKSQGGGCDTILLSKSQNGNSIVSRYLVRDKKCKSKVFEVRYALNATNISKIFDDNSAQMSDICNFACSKDSLIHIKTVRVCGYSSPDGTAKQNAVLAKERAIALKQYVENCCHSKYVPETTSKALKWSDCLPVVEKASMMIKDKGNVIRILNGKYTEPEKERLLHGMSDVWNIFTTEILPDMRYASVEFDYTEDSVIEHTEVVQQPKPLVDTTAVKPTVQTPQSEQPVEAIVVEESETGIIVDMTPSGEKGDNGRHKQNRENHEKSHRHDNQ